MSAAERKLRGGLLLGLLSSPVRVAYLVGVGIFLWCVAQFYRPDTGFSSLISIGDLLSDSKVSALRTVPHYIYESSPGYDGAYYVQLALNPTLDNPELEKAIDNLPYRAKRILFCWSAWVLGAGQPAWIVQAHALLNVICWLALGWVLLRWFPPDRWENALRWLAVMFSHGVIMSVRHSLVDAPSLLLVALAMRWLETGRSRAGAVTLAFAGLGKETSLLATAGLDFDWRAPRTWGRVALNVGLVALPLVLWMGYVRWKFGPAQDPGMGNFTRPLAGWIEKFGVAWREAFSATPSGLLWATLAVVLALAVQALFFALRPKPAERWWRVGVAFAGMMLFLSTPVWEGYPGASTRVLLPMTLAFNVLVPRGWRWLPVLLAGNLTVAATVFEFSPPHEFYELRGEATARGAVRVLPASGWHGPERHLQQHWRWSTGRAELRLTNSSDAPLQLAVRATASSAGGMRSVRVSLGERLLWGDTVGEGAAPLRFGLTLPPGVTTLVFSTDKPAEKVGTDPRALAFQIANLEIVVQRKTGSQ
ncbi:hypothetical protein [Horticoccus sp. 23ND18S-11]|uniref:hypothetical protein n=1 Tax=Horticoccus sp. 23ND18S-11 TaxID=3391832 RepID=UPI0039C8D509